MDKMHLVTGQKDGKLTFYKPESGLSSIDDKTESDNRKRSEKIFEIKEMIADLSDDLLGDIEEFGNGIDEIDIVESITKLQSKLSELLLVVIEREDDRDY